MRDTLKMVDRRAMDHGSRVAYIMYKMLECKGGYEKFELADFVFMASLHDIGAYKTDDLQDMVFYECKETKAHATYGYLIFKHLSPLSELSSIVLYHHTDYDQLEKLNYEYKDIAAVLSLAEKIDIFSGALGKAFSIDMFKKQVGTVVSKEAFDLFEKADSKFDILQKVKKGSYKAELDDIIEYMIFTNEDKKKYLEMLMYCQGFISERSVTDTVTCMCVAEVLGIKMRLSELEMEQIYYASLLHDIGMLAIPREIIDAPRSLTDEEFGQVKMHVHLSEKVLKGKMADEVVEMVAVHHERCDGSGYPRGLREMQVNLCQEVLQLADTVTALLSVRTYRPAFDEKKIAFIITQETTAGKYNKTVARAFLDSSEEIMKK